MKYGNLTVIGEEKRDRRIFWKCLCKCGNQKSIYANSVKTGATKSCGCLRKTISAQRATTHGKYGIPEYVAWRQMLWRCGPLSKDRIYYADKGIAVCSRWLTSFENFYTDMGLRPSPKHSLDRINNNGNYEPSNCRWTTKDIQSQNSRQSKIWVVFGVEFDSARKAAEIHGVDTATIRNWCNGINRSIYRYPPKQGCHCYLRYGD